MSLTYFAADLCILCVFLCFVFHGIRVGFARVLLSFAASLGAVAAAVFFAGPAGQWIYDNFARGALYDYVFSGVSKAGSGAVVSDLLPPGVVQLLQNIGINSELLAEKLSLSGETASAISQRIVDGAAGAALLETLKLFMAPVITVIFVVVLNLLFIPLNSLIKKIPVIKKFNRLLGGALGAVKGLIAVFVISVLAAVAAPLSANPLLIELAGSSKIIQLVASMTGIGG